MKFELAKNNGELRVALEGRLDTVTAPEFESLLDENYDRNCFVVIDCEKLTYISSAGLRVLLGAQKKTKGELKLVKVCELIMEVLEMTGFSDILVIE